MIKHALARPCPDEWLVAHSGSDDNESAEDHSLMLEAEWSIDTFVFSPTDIGAPVRRPRRYSMGLWLPNIGRIVDYPDFKVTYFQPQVSSAVVFLQAVRAQQRQRDDSVYAEGLTELVSVEAGSSVLR